MRNLAVEDKKEKKNQKTAIDAAYSYLAARMRTTEELRKYLKATAGVIAVHDEALEMGGAGITVVELA